MLYINYKLVKELEEEGHFAFDTLKILTAINQGEKEVLFDILPNPESYNLTFKGKSLVKLIKPKNKQQTWYDLARLDKAGKDLLKEVTEAECEEQDEVILKWLCDHYQKIGKETGNKKKTLRHIRDFRIKSGISKNNLIRLCHAFVSDETNMEYSHKLEYIFYKPKTVFETKFDLEESRLYQYYIKHKESFDKIFTEDGI